MEYNGGLIYTPYNDLHKLFGCFYDFTDKVKEYSDYFCLDFHKRNNSAINFICLKKLNDIKLEPDNGMKDIKDKEEFFVCKSLQKKFVERFEICCSKAF